MYLTDGADCCSYSTAQVEEETRELATLVREEKELHDIIGEYKNDIKGILMRQRMIQMVNDQRLCRFMLMPLTENRVKKQIEARTYPRGRGGSILAVCKPVP